MTRKLSLNILCNFLDDALFTESLNIKTIMIMIMNKCAFVDIIFFLWGSTFSSKWLIPFLFQKQKSSRGCAVCILAVYLQHVHSKRAVHWTEDINVRVECVTEIHGDLHHLADSSDVFFAQLLFKTSQQLNLGLLYFATNTCLIFFSLEFSVSFLFYATLYL